MTKVLIVEDLAALREHAARLVAGRIEGPPQVVTADNGRRGLEMFGVEKPDLVIMDISMPEMSGIKAAQEIWSAEPRAKILFRSQYHREAYVREIGRIVPDEAIHGYALKSEPDDKFVYAVESVLVHENPYIDPLVRGVQTRLQCKDRSLSDVEYETLLDIFTGLTDKAIALRRHISVRGVQNRLAMLSAKLIGGQEAHLKESAGMEVLNVRSRLVFEGVKRGLIDADSIEEIDSELSEWLEDELDYRRD